MYTIFMKISSNCQYFQTPCGFFVAPVVQNAVAFIQGSYVFLRHSCVCTMAQCDLRAVMIITSVYREPIELHGSVPVLRFGSITL